MESVGETQRTGADDAAELRTERLIRADGVGLWDWDLQTNELYFSPEWKRQIGYAPDELADEYREWVTRLHPADIGATLEAGERFRQGETSTYDVEFRLRHKDGTYRWIWAQADLLRDAQGCPARMMGSHIDITRRKEAELALRDSERELRRITDNIQGTVSRVGRDLRYRYVNRWYERVFGVQMDEAVGRHMAEVLGDEVFSNAFPYVERVLQGETVTFDSSFEIQGGLHSAITTFIPDCGGDGEIAGFFVVGLDVTDLKRVEAALRDSQERMQLALEATSDGVWDWSVAAETVYYSPQWARLLGYEPHEVTDTVQFFIDAVH
ncbi:MAG: PAS domain S-box protein, partial [Gemmatimonadaceae bacterium]|nr:PAS domain S-box protein [Gemmatimonadaceae bacterium]